MNIKELLPIGSIVLLKDGEKRLMIDGVMQSNEGGNGEEYDYFVFKLHRERGSTEDWQNREVRSQVKARKCAGQVLH